MGEGWGWGFNHRLRKGYVEIVVACSLLFPMSYPAIQRAATLPTVGACIRGHSAAILLSQCVHCVRNSETQFQLIDTSRS